MNAYDNVSEFEQRVADYAGAAFGIAVNSCTNALLLSMVCRFLKRNFQRIVLLPKRTYVGVAQAVLAAGAVCAFQDLAWEGAYELHTQDDAGTVRMGIVDSARRFRQDMVWEWPSDTLYCLSFHWYKHLPLGGGGMILTNSPADYLTLRRMRYDGRTVGVAASEDTYDVPGFHCLMTPETATRGLMLMDNAKADNRDLPWDGYADLSEHALFTRGWR